MAETAEHPDYKVKARYLIRGPNRLTHTYYWAVNRGWTKDWLEVGVVEGDEDPVEQWTDESSGTPVRRTRPILNLISETQLKELEADDINMVVRPINGAGETEGGQAVDVLAVIKERDELKAANKVLVGDVEKLKADLRETTKLLEDATRPIAAVAERVASRRGR